LRRSLQLWGPLAPGEPGMLRTEFMDGKSASFGSIDIPDYAEAVAQYRTFVNQANGNLPGDSKLLAARPTVAGAQMPTDSNVQNAITAAWH